MPCNRLFWHKTERLASGEAEKGSSGNDDQNEEEELLSQAIALSEENEEENYEEELLRQAIALSLEV